MTKRIALFFCLATIFLLLTLTALAQETATIKGVCKDESGKALAGASVEFANVEKGSTTTAKISRGGEYKSPGLPAGSYNVKLIAADGTPLYVIKGVPAKSSMATVVDFNLAKLKAESAKESEANAEQRKQNETIKQENEKIQGLNALLKQAAQQKKEKQYAAAVATMEKAAAQDQTHDIIYGALADCYELDGKFPEAANAYTKALALAPPGSKSVANYHEGLALVLLQQGKIDSSLAECDETARIDRALAGQCYYNAGFILANQGHAESANQAFDKALSADPGYAEAYYQKGINLIGKATMGKDNKMVPVPGTVENLRKYLELAPEGKYAQSARDLLASIGATVEATYGSEKKGDKKK